jgi:Uma2 family endonuclease
VVEILSEDNRPSLVREKLVDYALIDVNEVWILDPNSRMLEVLFREGSLYSRDALFTEFEEIRSRVLPELRLPLRRIFEE